LKKVGWYSEDEGLHLDDGFQLEIFDNWETTTIYKSEMFKTTTQQSENPVSSSLIVIPDRSVFGRSIDQMVNDENPIMVRKNLAFKSVTIKNCVFLSWLIY